jgi:2-polyprenyl-6-hydroxyphenyl methylase/3-demethylubiquinone-9 3-methyltransferase
MESYMESVASKHDAEVRSGDRFEFGKNWQRFLRLLNDDRIRQAEVSLKQALRVDTLAGKRFLDIGSGSGLFSLAARRLGATVHSFDYDPQSVACTRELRARFFPADSAWTVESGSVLDRAYLKSLGQFDVVYSWGVLHHTGAMWQALENVVGLVAPGGKLMLAIYNDQGTRSQRWRWVKRTYNRLPRWLQWPVLVAFFIALNIKPVLRGLLRGRPLETLRAYGQSRGMDLWRDLEDWVGGYPFEVAKPEELFEFYRSRGFSLLYLTTTNSHGCNELVFERLP